MTRCLAPLLLLCAAVTAPGETLFDFSSRETPMRLNRAEARDQTLAFTGNALKLTWNAEKFIYAELIPSRMPEIPVFARAEFTARATTAGPCPVRLFNLRLLDATGETFQWNRAVDWRQAGTYEVTRQVTPENADLHWGGNNDGKLDFPVSFSGLSIDFHKGSGSGELLIDSAAVLPSDGKRAWVRSEYHAVLADFSKKYPPLRLNRPEKRGQNAVVADNSATGRRALKITWDNARHPYFEWSFTPASPLPEFTGGRIEVDVTTTGPCPARRFNVRMIDATGETFQWEQPVDWQAAGTHRLVFEVTPTNCSQSWDGDKDRKITFPVSFLGVSADFRKDSGPGELLLDALHCRLDTRQPLVDAVEFAFDTSSPVNVIAPDGVPQLCFRNRLNAPLRADARLTFRNFDGRNGERVDLDSSNVFNFGAGMNQINITHAQMAPERIGFPAPSGHQALQRVRRGRVQLCCRSAYRR
ncbi:MAG: hypothetical protein HPZ91_10745 [Lentisphaeria bacterium]|nr:hypothetical protein [Lentisphaeria bacterium]